MTFITDKERAIMKRLGPNDIALLGRLNLPSLTSKKKDIVGIRCEDIFSFMQFVKDGSYPVAGDGSRTKTTRGLYLIPNPESEDVKTTGNEAVNGLQNFYRTFSSAAYRTDTLYSDIARIGPISRELRPRIKDEQKMVKEYLGENFKGESVENFYRDLLMEVDRSKPSFDYKNRLRALYHLGKNLDENGREIALDIFNKTGDRGAIMIGFDKKLITRYGAPGMSIEGADICFPVKEGGVALDSVVGYEALGDFEDEVLDLVANR
jgi:hypothetical protein